MTFPQNVKQSKDDNRESRDTVDENVGPQGKPETLSLLIKRKPAYKNADRATYFRDKVTGEKYYQCPVCPKRLKGHLTIHLRTHSGKKPWKCSQCSKTFSQKCNLQTHIKCVHDAGQRFKCELCHKSFDYKKNLERHVNAHLLERPYKCTYCSRRFSSIDWLCRHKRTHTGEKPYICVFCPNVRFAEYGKVTHHLRLHTGERPYFCKHCDKTFTSSSYLLRHTKTVHRKTEKTTTSVAASCLFCAKVFCSSGRLFKHLMFHIGEATRSSQTQHACKYSSCDKVYGSRNAILRHIKLCHLSENERPFPCQFCNRSFTEFNLLRDHVVIHTKERPEQCTICWKRFSTKRSLNMHVKIIH